MNSTDARTSRTRELAREHAHIRKAIEEVVSRLDRTATDPGDRVAFSELSKKVASFREHLERHFWLEEAGGLLGDAVQYYDSEARRTADELVTEHRNFERRIGQINEQLDLALRDPRGPTEALGKPHASELFGFFRDLADHERAETELLQRLVLRRSEELSEASTGTRNSHLS